MALLLLYLFLTYLQPTFYYPWLVDYRPLLLVGLVALVAAFMSGLTHRVSIKVPQLGLLLLLNFVVALSAAKLGWVGGIAVAVQQFFIDVALFYLVFPNVINLRRMAIVVTVFAIVIMVLCGESIAAVEYGYNADLLIEHQQNGINPADGSKIILDRLRSVGPLSDPNDFSQVIVVLIPFLFLPAMGWRKMRFALITVPTLAVSIYTIYLTHSRGAVLGLAAIVIAALYSSKVSKTRLTIMSLVLLGIGSVANMTGGRGFQTDDSVEGRFNAWSVALQLLKRSPLLGVGMGQFTEYNDLTAHNSLVLCFAELGIVGCFLWLGLIVVSMLQLNSLAKMTVDDELSGRIVRWAKFIRTAFIGFLVTAFSLSRTFAATLYLLVGMSAALAQIATRSGKWQFTRPTFSWMKLTASIEMLSIPGIWLFLRFHHL